MKQRVGTILLWLAVAFAASSAIPGVSGLLRMWNERRDVNCDWPGVPFEAMDGCRLSQALAAWGQ